MIELACLEEVEGSNRERDLVLFALSTCPWCLKARKFLEGNDIAYRYAYVDLLEGAERAAAVDELKKWNPAKNLPTLVIDDDEVIVGFREPEYQEKLL